MHRRSAYAVLLLALASVALVFVRGPASKDLDGPAETWADTGIVPDIVRLRMAAMARLARDVADGRRTLLEVAALFAALDRVEPAVPLVLPEKVGEPEIPIPTRTPDELYCWRVARWVYGLAPAHPGGNAAAVARAAAEVRATIATRGEIRLAHEAGAASVESLLQSARAELDVQTRGRAGRPSAEHLSLRESRGP
jgi:hypothetical protein